MLIVAWYLVERMKTYLFIMRHFPHYSSHVQETLDQLLTTAAFDQNVSLLFVDDGVCQLKAHQNPKNILLKNSAAIFQVLDVYAIHNLYVEAESLSAKGLNESDLILPVKLIRRAAVNDLMQQHAVLIPD